ncbi:transketolase C-terminal domain-containing protein [Candidatus Purcelliella pentastirinorum]|nr:transketolase C-terminal domain-containing protein [Candidatus Purcelliella pentastirinorum]
MSLITIGKGVILRCGKDLVILNFGILLFDIYKIVKIFNTTLVDMRFIQPLDDDLIIKLSEHHKYFVIIEKGIIKG